MPVSGEFDAEASKNGLFSAARSL
ncbi:hypothetical protein Atc_2097 [Acidithiobacillus caldus SM-1]|uniref:Uncharacterized protein n=1 Tax=Acidithiobacillus caldus (strain SM-1) TaxID=990288 RepID=F9ZRW1_ACICS|nr:hypothetical protein Atc_2097 [Acidithiobacillus caldus SM-1]